MIPKCLGRSKRSIETETLETDEFSGTRPSWVVAKHSPFGKASGAVSLADFSFSCCSRSLDVACCESSCLIFLCTNVLHCKNRAPSPSRAISIDFSYGGYLLKVQIIKTPGEVFIVVMSMLLGAYFLGLISPHLMVLLNARVAAASIYQTIERVSQMRISILLITSTRWRHSGAKNWCLFTTR